MNGLSEGSPFHDFPFRMVPPSYVSWFINPMKTSSFVRCGDPILLKEMPKTWKAAGPLTIGHSCLEETSRSSPARCTRIGPPKFRPRAVQKPDDICYIQNGVASNVNNPMINWLVVSTPLKNMSSSVGMIIPNIWKVIKKKYKMY